MTLQKICFLLALFTLLAACKSGKPFSLAEVPTDFLKGDTKLSSEFFFIGPEIDSVKAEVVADCDCCASELIFLNDSSFIYSSLCLEGDSYVKGNYVVFGDLLILHTDEEVISSEYSISPDGEDAPTSYEMVRQERAYHFYKISNLKGKQVIAYSEGDYAEYGIPTHGSLKKVREEFRKEKILRSFWDSE